MHHAAPRHIVPYFATCRITPHCAAKCHTASHHAVPRRLMPCHATMCRKTAGMAVPCHKVPPGGNKCRGLALPQSVKRWHGQAISRHCSKKLPKNMATICHLPTTCGGCGITTHGANPVEWPYLHTNQHCPEAPAPSWTALKLTYGMWTFVRAIHSRIAIHIYILLFYIHIHYTPVCLFIHSSAIKYTRIRMVRPSA